MGYEDYQRLTFDRRDHGVLLITMNRPEKYNAADEQMHTELAGVWTEVSADPETRVAVVTGAGKAFSAGGDLDMVRRMAGDYDRVSHMLREMSDLVYNIINCEKPIVSAINGVAVGAGTVVNGASPFTIKVAGRRWGLFAATRWAAVSEIKVAITAEVEVSGPPMAKGKELRSATAPALVSSLTVAAPPAVPAAAAVAAVAARNVSAA